MARGKSNREIESVHLQSPEWGDIHSGDCQRTFKMRTFELRESVTPDRDFQNAGERNEASSIAAEIAVRLIEMKDVAGDDRPVSLLRRMLAVHDMGHQGPAAFWLLLRLMTGSLDEISKSFSELAEERGCTKQNVQQRQRATLAALGQQFPELTSVIEKLRRVRSPAASKVVV